MYIFLSHLVVSVKAPFSSLSSMTGSRYRCSQLTGSSRHAEALSREFKKYTGTTIHELLLDVRINYATELLKYSDKTVNEITFACGMNHVSHFIRQFQKRTGLTPLAYRQQWR